MGEQDEPGGTRALKGVATRPAPGDWLLGHVVSVPYGMVGAVRVVGADPVVATAVVTRNRDGGEGTSGAVPVRLGRLLWSRAGVRPGDAVDIEWLDVADADRVAVAIHERARDSAEAVVAALHGMCVVPGALLEVEAAGGVVMARVVDVAPAPSQIGAGSNIDVAWVPDPITESHVGLADVGGAADVVARLLAHIDLPVRRPERYRLAGIRRPRGALLHGPPGTGKTLICRALANELGLAVFLSSGSDLVAGLRGETEKRLRDLFRDALASAPALIVIDEFDAIGGHRDRLSSQDDVRGVSQLLALMDGLEEFEGVFVLGTTNRAAAVDDAFRRPGRFDLEVHIGAPDREGRLDILNVLTRAMPLDESAIASLPEIADKAVGFVGADLMQLARDAGLSAISRVAENEDSITVAGGDLERALDQLRPSVLSGLDASPPELAWNDIVGLDQEKGVLLDAADAVFQGRSERTEGVLIHGATGNGKSVLAHALAARVGARLITLEQAQIYRPWLGESEGALREFFERALSSRPAVVLLEHLSSLAPARSTVSSERTDDRVRAALLASLDRVNRAGGVLVIGVAARLEDVAPEVIRPGRLGVHVAVPDPGAGRRRQLIRQVMGDAEPDEALETLVAETAGMSAAGVVVAAARTARR